MKSAKQLRAANWFGGKTLLKQSIAHLPLYHPLTLLLRRLDHSVGGRSERAWLSRIPVAPGRSVEARVLDQRFVLTRPERCSIAKSLFWTDGLRAPEEDRIALDLFAALAADAEVVLDIGANSGLFSLAAAACNPRARVYAYDILPEAYEILVHNIIANDRVGAITPLLCGLGDANTEFVVPAMVALSEMPTSVSTEFKFAEGVRVPVRPLDEAAAAYGAFETLLIKIDVEGTELAVFRGALKTLKRHRPDILCEVLRSARDYAEYASLLAPLGYHFYCVTDTGLRAAGPLRPDAQFKDWLFSTRAPDALAAYEQRALRR